MASTSGLKRKPPNIKKEESEYSLDVWVAAKTLLLPNATGPYVRLFGNRFLSSVLKITTSPLPLRKSTKSINIKLVLKKTNLSTILGQHV